MNDTVNIKNNPFSSEEDWGFVVEDNTPESTNKAPSKRFHLYLMAPAIILLASITIYPFFWLIYMSLHKVKLGPAKDKFVGTYYLGRTLVNSATTRLSSKFRRI